MRRRILLGTLGVATVALLIGVLAAGAIRNAVQRQAEAELLRQAQVAANLIEREVQVVLERTDRARSQLTRAQINRVLEQIRIVGGHDYLEAAVFTTRGIEPLTPDPVLLPALGIGVGDVDTSLRRVTTVEVGGQRLVAALRAVDVTEDVRLLIAIGRTSPLLDVGAFGGPLFLGLLGGGVLAIILAFIFSARVARSMEALAAAAKQVAAGDLDVEVPESDIDELAIVARAFNEMTAELQASRRRERDFLMSVGHDLRTPLTTIRGYAEALEAGTVPPDDLPRVAAVLDRQADRLSRLVEDLMLLARLEAREFTLRPEPVDVAAHLREVVEPYRHRAEEERVRFAADLPDVGVVVTDPDRLGQVVANLLDNALRYTPEGGAVELRVGRDGEALEVEVSDTGPGIDPEDLPHVFDRLFVARRYRPVRPEGSGLGLSIVRELVEAMGGDIDVASEPGRGTRFRVRLPVAALRGADSSGVTTG